MSSAENDNYNVPDWIKTGAVVAVGSLVVAGAIRTFVGGLPEVDSDHGYIKSEVQHVAPLDIEFKGIMVTDNEAHIRSKLFKLFGGFKADLKVPTETLFGAKGSGVLIEETPDGATKVSIDADSITLFTRMKEDEREQTADNARGISGMGDGIADQLDGLSLPNWKGFDKNQQSDIAKELAVRVVNRVDTKCAEAIFMPTDSPITAELVAVWTDQVQAPTSLAGQVIFKAYQIEAERKGRDPQKVEVSFRGTPDFKETYESTYDSKVFPITKFDYEPTCKIAPGALDLSETEIKPYVDSKLKASE